MKRAWPLYAPSLTGCMLVAGLFFGYPEASGALARPVAGEPPLAIAGTKPLLLSRVQTGMASWYGRRWQGRLTASGERYDRHQPTAAHRTAPLGTQTSSDRG
jgi:rare lipoprotein A